MVSLRLQVLQAPKIIIVLILSSGNKGMFLQQAFKHQIGAVGSTKKFSEPKVKPKLYAQYLKIKPYLIRKENNSSLLSATTLSIMDTKSIISNQCKFIRMKCVLVY